MFVYFCNYLMLISGMSQSTIRPTGSFAHVGTCTLMQHLVIYDGRQSHLELLNNTYKTSYTLKDIRATGNFNSSSRIYCMVMFRVNLQPPSPMQVRLRVGWGEGFPPVVCQTIQSIFAKKAAKTEMDTVTNQPVDDDSKSSQDISGNKPGRHDDNDVLSHDSPEKGEKRPLEASQTQDPGPGHLEQPEIVAAEVTVTVTSLTSGNDDCHDSHDSKRQKTCSDDDVVGEMDTGPKSTEHITAEPAEAATDDAVQSTEQLVSKLIFRVGSRGGGLGKPNNKERTYCIVL